jgi:MscS family membrane protein
MMIELFNSVEAGIVSLTPNPWLQATAFAIMGLLIAKLAELILVAVIGRLVGKTNNTIDDEVIRRLHKPVFTTFAVLGLVAASLRITESLGEQGLMVTTAVLKTIVIFSWLRFLIGSSSLLVESMGRNPTRFVFAQRDTVPLLRNLLYVILALAGAYAILISWDINVTGLVASAGIVGLALSFAAQDTLSHLFAGVAILADRPYRIGDFIVLDTGERGEVTEIGLRSTRLMTRDNVEIVIPNGVMGTAKINNESGGPTSFRIRASIGVAYGSDVDHVVSVLDNIIGNLEGFCSEPAPRTRFRAFGPSSLDFELLAWITNPALRGLQVHNLNCEIYRRFTEEGIKIPFPQHDVWVRELPAELKTMADDTDQNAGQIETDH